MDKNKSIKDNEHRETSIDALLEKWEEQKDILSTLFSTRNKAAAVKETMNESIQQFLSFLFWSNGRDIPDMEIFEDGIANLEYKPINFSERFDFINKNPGHHHSFIQLNELYNEQLKQYAKWKLKHKK